MTAFDKASLNPNGRALQLYLGVEFVHDSSFPLSPTDDVIIHPVGDVGLLVLEETALNSAYPIEVPEPPAALQRPNIDYPDLDLDSNHE
jgi:hypothetical protein